MVVEVSNIETISVLNEPDVIHVGFNLIQEYISRDIISSINNVSNYVVITDNNVAPLHLEKLMASIQSRLVNGQRLLYRILPSGEQSKCRETKANIEDYLLSTSCTRDTCLIALGGGVIGDLVGYTASTFMRGVPFVQIPTTLLAMVDSSIGGKTAIDTPHGKNLIGTFWQPKRIYLDLSVLNTLPKREVANGMAEVIKTAAISSESEFNKIENGPDKINAALSVTATDANREFLASIVTASARFKANVVTQDEREGNLRGLLNFGHSIGHALEAILYPKWLHGECVSVGLVLEAQLSCNLGHCPTDVVHRLANCLQLYGLPINYDEVTRNNINLSQVMNTMKVDKKNKGAQKRIVLLSKIGQTFEQKASDVPDNAIEKVLAPYVKQQEVTEMSSFISPRQEQHFIEHPHLELISLSKDLDDLLVGLNNILKNRFNCSAILSSHASNDGTSDDTILVYFTTKAGSTITRAKGAWYEYVVLPHQVDYHFYNGAMAFITDILYGQQERHIRPSPKRSSSFVTVTIPSYATALPVLVNQWLEGADAIEFRVDLLTPQETDKNWIIIAGTELAHLRQKTKLPIVYTVRTIPQAGKFDPVLTALYKELLKWGHRWGCDYVDLELTTMSNPDIAEMMMFTIPYKPINIIISYHDPNHMFPWSGNVIFEVYNEANNLLRNYKNEGGVIKIVGYAESFIDNIELEQFRNKVDPNNDRALILINMGPQGKLSRVTNRFLNPATHPSLPTVAAPGQLSITELSRLRAELNLK